MAYQLEQVNAAVRRDPAAYMAQCDQIFHHKVAHAADHIQRNLPRSPVVLLSGPSGSGKTTTAGMVEQELEKRGISTHTISLDDYYTDPDPVSAPRTPEGALDFESPLLLDIPLLDDHFTRLAKGEEVTVPHFDFTRRQRDGRKGRALRLQPNEVAIFEGIHALNPQITGKHPEATRMYISTQSNVMDHTRVCFKRTWLRLVRRTVRDYNFRGTGVEDTLEMWANVCRGERQYITPYRRTAHIRLDTTLPYEVSVMAQYARPMLSALPAHILKAHELDAVLRAFDQFAPIRPDTIPPASLLHEFIG